MNIGSMLALGVALSMDAVTVSVSNGVASAGFCKRNALKTGLFFGFFQALMPVLGYIAGSRVARYIEKLGPWVAFAFLLVLGVQMIHGALRPSARSSGVAGTGALLLMSIATSIDALAVGVSLAFVGADIFLCAAVIGLVTFVLSVFGGLMGGKLGEKFQKQAGVAGGAMLILVGFTLLA